jgi:hypothetical protein
MGTLFPSVQLTTRKGSWKVWKMLLFSLKYTLKISGTVWVTEQAWVSFVVARARRRFLSLPEHLAAYLLVQYAWFIRDTYG